MGVLPHAGLMYSGRFIRDFFSNLDSSIDRVLVISPSHYHVLPEDTFVISSFDSAASPLGSVPVFRPDLPGAMVCDEAIQSEHALEMFIPFCAARSLAVGFAVVGDVSGRDALDALARDVRALLDGRTALIASSDFTHYGRRCRRRKEGRRRGSEDRIASLSGGCGWNSSDTSQKDDLRHRPCHDRLSCSLVAGPCRSGRGQRYVMRHHGHVRRRLRLVREHLLEVW